MHLHKRYTLGSVPPPDVMVAQKCLIQTLVLAAYVLLIQTVTVTGWIPPKFIEDWTTTSLRLTINQTCLKILLFMSFRSWTLNWHGGSLHVRDVFDFFSIKCYTFSLPNYKPSKSVTPKRLLLFSEKLRAVLYPCKPDVIHSVPNRTSHATAIIGCTGFCYLFVPELSSGTTLDHGCAEKACA